ncbi:hypothetical protein Bbelb_120010 [Branchiostoma belcheri]|nr:hypothetical protein Bbelb_120010 [Branchiostoma belcheri]
MATGRCPAYLCSSHRQQRKAPHLGQVNDLTSSQNINYVSCRAKPTGKPSWLRRGRASAALKKTHPNRERLDTRLAEDWIADLRWLMDTPLANGYCLATV